MAEAALLGIANSVLGQLATPAFQEFLLVCNSKKDLKHLKQTIQTITDYLHDAEQKESTNHLVRGWLSRLKKVLYEADDLFDSASFMVLHKKTMSGNSFKKEVRLFFSKSNQLGFAFKIAHEVKAIRERLEGIKDDMIPFSFTLIKPNEVEEKLVREETHSFVKVEEVFGRDRERDEIIRLLLPEDNSEEGQSLSVVSIIGFGGLGKTTLAQLVYNDERVQSGFDMCVWACINYLSDLNQVLGTILASIPKSKPGDKNLEQLQRELRESIEGKKYLLVLDDVWDENASNWLKLKTLLSCGKDGSKVLVTTRSKQVAQCLDSLKPDYELKVLSEESAWRLFVKMAFKKDELSLSDSDELVHLGKEIVRKCGYVPLALVAIGRMLRYRKKEVTSWKSFVDKELPEVLLGHDVDKVKLMQVLKVSYNDHPLALKHCFAYCSLFPKDYIFRKDQLVRLWIAQGFIVPHGKKSLEEVGDDCFFHMVDRCFFQEVAMSSEEGCLGYTCKIHDLQERSVVILPRKIWKTWVKILLIVTSLSIAIQIYYLIIQVCLPNPRH